MRVLFINPRATYAGEIAQKCYPPLNLMYLCASLAEAGHEAKIVDANAQNLSDDEIVSEAARWRPGLVGMPVFSTISHHVYKLSDMLRKARGADAVQVLGGPEASAIPDETLKWFYHVDYVLRGESEKSICQLCEAIEGRRSLDRVDGLSHWGEGRVVHNRDAEPARDLDRTPRPARHLAEDAYRDGLYYTILVRHRPVDTIITSRGCPFRCGFCYNTNHTYRFRSPEDVVDEICQIAARGIRDIEICDDTFTANRKRAARIFDLIRKEKLGLSFRIKSRVNAMDGELMRKAKAAGVYIISFGMESGVQEMLDRMNKRIKVEQIAEAVRMCRAAGIMSHGSFVIGYPGETPATVKRTVNFIVGVKPTTVNVVALVPFPNTQVYQEAKDAGWLEGDWDPRTGYVPWAKLPWMETRADLDRVARRARQKVYFRLYYATVFTREIVRNFNLPLALYAKQEAAKTLGKRGPKFF
ncbi:radical SAM protein [bacterium]|nr:radical SAM protein [bacterium]